MNNNLKNHIQREFLALNQKQKILQSSSSLCFQTATLPKNRDKNRYPNILALESSRVPLFCEACGNVKTAYACKNCQENYINGNYVSSPYHEKQFIACQAPIPNTFDSFWKMIWQQNVNLIVMLTPLEENGTLKSHLYFPSNEREALNFGDFSVYCISCSYDRIIIREFYVKCTIRVNHEVKEEVRRLYHIQYCHWPDHDIPESMEDIFSMVQMVDKVFSAIQSPIVIHCSAGVGRTGTFLAIYNCIASLRLYGYCDIANTVQKIRGERYGSVSRESQYGYIYKVVMYYIDFNSRGVSSNSTKI